MKISCAPEPDLSTLEFVDILHRSTLAERRPVDRPDRTEQMLRHAGTIMTARTEGQLVGVARAISDFSDCTYLSDLAVDSNFQRQGIGKELIRQTHLATGSQTSPVLLAAPKARTYYPAIGMTPHDSCWMFPPGSHETSSETES